MIHGLSRLRWRGSKLRRRVKASVYRRLMRDDGGESVPCILVAGSPRSGTTWIGDVLAAGLHSRVLFEPFNPELVREFRRFHLFEYRRREEPCAELREFCSSLFSGRIQNAWIDREVDRLRPASRLVKAVRGNLLLDWIDRNFPDVPKILVIRHPCAVAVSRMRLGWDTDRDIEPLLAQPRLVDDFLAERLPLIRSASRPEEKHAVIWCVHNLVPLAQLGPDRLHVVFYEDLVGSPGAAWEGVFRWLGHPVDTATLSVARRPSTTSRTRSAVIQGGDPLTQWQQDLTPDQITRIRQIVDGFGLDYLYGDATTPSGTAGGRLRQSSDERPCEEPPCRSPHPAPWAARLSAPPEPHR